MSQTIIIFPDTLCLLYPDVIFAINFNFILKMIHDRHIDGLEQICSKFIANELELLQSSTKPSKYAYGSWRWGMRAYPRA